MTDLATRRTFLRFATSTASGAFALSLLPSKVLAAAAAPIGTVRPTEAQWRARLTPEAFEILRQAGTERPFSSGLLNEHRRGSFSCAGCALPLFSSTTKFDSGTGWPSFWDHDRHAIAERHDGTLGMDRTEVRCARCDGHLGHVFDDGPRPTGLRYCMNGAAMHFHTA